MQPALCRTVLAAAFLACGLLPARAEEPGDAAPAEGTLVVRRWLALDGPDTRGRVPFNRNTPFLRYLLDRAAPPPKAEEKVRGDLGEKAWRPVEAAEDGTVRDETGAWFYGAIEAPAERVFLAHLDGASALFVNGAGFVGDVYGGGFGPVPVALRKGTNHLFVAGGRGGAWGLQLEPWEEGRSPILAEDATLPDLVEGVESDCFAAVRILNPSTEWVAVPAFPSVDVRARFDGTESPPQHTLPLAMLPRGYAPLWAGKAFAFLGRSTTKKPAGPTFPFQARAWSAEGKSLGKPVDFRLDIRKPTDPRRVTFFSAMDPSVQYYAVLPPAKSDLPPERIGTVLALHGASVDAIGLPGCYSPKPDLRIVAPTNRRPFGFDWQDWGREDAYETLDQALGTFGGDPARVYLTGHSMGGHGVWHLAANDPGRWAAIAPSAGWCSFDTYGGGPRPETPLTTFWRSCDGGSRTEDLVARLVGTPIFVLHGTKDDNVPLSEAERMLDLLRKAGGKPLHHFQEGAGHWWDGDASTGVDCVDWPGIFDLFRSAPPGPQPPREARPRLRGFKRAFDNGFALVVGTKGSEEENREMLELARYHSGQWWYRANGSAAILRDTDLLATGNARARRNLVLYGNEDANAAWKAEFRAGSPLSARRGEIRLGERSWKGDGLGAVFVFPRTGEEGALVGAFASTGPRGTRLGYGLLPFVSGVGYPDYAVFGTEFLAEGDGGVLAAGWFDATWGLQPGGFVRDGGKGK